MRMNVLILSLDQLVSFQVVSVSGCPQMLLVVTLQDVHLKKIDWEYNRWIYEKVSLDFGFSGQQLRIQRIDYHIQRFVPWLGRTSG